jgi:hypothetical protein
MAHVMRHNGVMEVSPFVDKLGREFAALAQTDSEDAAARAARLESVIRRTLFDALAAAVDEINRDLVPGSVELRLRGNEPNFVVTPPSPDSSETATGRGTPNRTLGTADRRGKRARQRYTAWVR